jgi:hypothetical protein
MVFMSDVPNGLFDTAVHVKPPLEGAAVGVGAVAVSSGGAVALSPLLPLLSSFLQVVNVRARVIESAIKIVFFILFSFYLPADRRGGLCPQYIQ